MKTSPDKMHNRHIVSVLSLIVNKETREATKLFRQYFPRSDAWNAVRFLHGQMFESKLPRKAKRKGKHTMLDRAVATVEKHLKRVSKTHPHVVTRLKILKSAEAAHHDQPASAQG